MQNRPQEFEKFLNPSPRLLWIHPCIQSHDCFSYNICSGLSLMKVALSPTLKKWFHQMLENWKKKTKKQKTKIEQTKKFLKMLRSVTHFLKDYRTVLACVANNMLPTEVEKRVENDQIRVPKRVTSNWNFEICTNFAGSRKSSHCQLLEQTICSHFAQGLERWKYTFSIWVRSFRLVFSSIFKPPSFLLMSSLSETIKFRRVSTKCHKFRLEDTNIYLGWL